MESSTEPASKSSTRNVKSWLRHGWFPLLVIVGLAVRVLPRWTDADPILLQAPSIFLAAVLISAWYLWFGGSAWRRRMMVVTAGWLAVVGWVILFRPVFNGAMGITGWRLRFAADADRRLGEMAGAGVADEWQTTPHDYPRFLGSGYWPEVTGVRLERDWQTHPPQEMWRREIGAGWSAFAVAGNYALTQEQRGDQELVSCRQVEDGQVVWTHADQTRFDPDDLKGGLGGIGPRATPTIASGKVITQGGTGIVNCLDARTGAVLWSHDTAEEFDTDVLVWGKSGSPLVAGDLVIVNVGSPSDPAAREQFNASLVAFDLETGAVRWTAGNRRASYASPMVATLAGQRQIVMVNESYVTSHRLTDGEVLWEHPWAHEQDYNASASQPIPLPGDRLLLSKGYGVGASLIDVARDDAGQWAVQPVWSPPIKPVMKTKFTNAVLRDGFVYGLDDVILECIELETGTVQWKKRRQPPFGYGQIMLVGDVILVLTESGELLLVEASPERYHELAGIQALDRENVTWNTPAFAPPYLLIRNSREAACYRLPLAEGASAN